jgi:L-amino acid N-acyltransferase YncA
MLLPIAGYNFRLCQQEDLDKVADFYKTITNESKHFIPFREIFDSTVFLEEGRTNYVVTKGDKVIALMTVTSINSDTSSFGYAVLPEYRGQGIAKGMVERIIEQCRENHMRQIHATADRNNWKSILLLHSFGFKVNADEEILRLELKL